MSKILRDMMRKGRLFILGCCLLLIMLVGLSAPLSADQAQYIYDDLGRLSQVIDGQGNVATYTYDAVGNLLSITRNTGGVGAPTITALTPNTGNAGASVSVSITGTNLTGAALATDNPGILVRNVLTTTTSIAATFQMSFAARTGATAVTATTTTGSATTSFSVNASAPVVSALSPTSGPVTRLLTITGNGFSSTAELNQIRFNGLLTTTLSATATSLTTQVPSGATTGPVTVTVGGLVSNGVIFTVANAGPPPTLTSLFPNVGSVQGGQRTTLTGTGFIAGTTVKIRNKPASVLTLVSPTSMIVQVPASVVGPADVVVSNTNGDALIQNGYTYLAGPSQKLGTITPTMGLINIPRNVPVTVSFSRPVDRATITTANVGFTQGATPVAGTYSYDFGDTVVTFRPTAVLAATTAYTLSLTQGIKSVDGVPLDGGFVGSFTTGTNSDTVSPTVTISPANGATNVPFNTSIVLTFSEPINPNTVNAATVVVMSQGEVRPGTITFGQQNTFAVFTPASPFFPTASATVTVLGQVTDMAGNALQGSAGVGTSVTSTFTTSSVADRLPPVVLQVVPFNNATGISTRTSLSATFSESVNPTTLSPATFQVSSGGTPIAGTLSFSNFNQSVLFIPDNPFPPVATVNVSISNVSDVVGNVMVLPFTSSFQTQSAIDNIRPSVVRPSPSTFTFQPNPPSNTNVPLNFKPMIAFDERINPSTVNSTTFTLGLTGVGAIPSTITVAADGLSAILSPNQALLPNTLYNVSWTAGIQDLVGNTLLNAGSTSFTTGPVAIDVATPTVLDVSPRTGTQTLPVNATVTVLFSEPVSFTSITQQTVVLSTGGVPVNTQFALERNNTVLRIKPANLLPLQANKFYELTVTPGVLDLAGNPLASLYGSSFSTGAATDTTGPTMTTMNPAQGTTGISRQTTVSLTFSEPVNPIFVTPTTINIGSGAAGTMSVSPDLRMVTFTPTFPFFANSAISIQISGLEDLSGNTGSGSGFFTTAVAPGTVTANLPTTAAWTANPDTLFSDGVTTTTITISNISVNSSLVPNGTVIGVLPFDTNISFTGGGTILGGIQSQADPRVRLFSTFGGNVTFTYRSPNELLPTNNGGGVSVVSVDVAGAPIKVVGSGRVTFVRETSFLPSRNPSALLANGTSIGEMSLIVKDRFGNPVPYGTQVALTFEPVFPPTNGTSVGGTINGGVAAPDLRFKLFTTQNGGLIDLTYTAPSQAGTQSASGAIQAAEIDGSGNIVAKISTADGANDRFTLNGSSGFTGPQPAVLAVSPAHTQSVVGTNATVDALFSQSLDPTTVTSSTFSVNSGSAIPGTYSFLATDRGPNTLVRFTPTVPFAPSGTFTVAITVGIKNTAGIPLLSAISATFSTGTAADTVPPTVTQVLPPSGSLDVATNRGITVQFSEPLNATTLSVASFTVSTGGSPIGGRVTLGAGPNGPNTVATFMPAQFLSVTTGYDVALSASILDTAGNPLSTFGSGFTSGTGIDNFRPSVVSTSPPFNFRFAIPQNIPLNANVVLTFSEPMNPLTITSNSVQVAFATNAGGFQQNVPVSGILAMSSDLRTVTFTPAQPLAPNSTHTVTLGTSITDLAGNTVFPLVGTSFVTGVQAAETTPLTVTVSPAASDTGIAINAPVVLQFSRPVAPTTFSDVTMTVTGSAGPIPGTFAFEQENRVVRWKPANLIQMAPNTVHTVSVLTGVTDLAGVPLAALVSSSFTTGTGIDTTIPALVSALPANNATGVARTATITVTMSEPINPATVVVRGSVFLTGTGETGASGFASMPGTVSVSPNRRDITFTPEFPLLANQRYTFSVNGVEDLAGNKATTAASVGFVTAFAAGTALSALPSIASALANPTTLLADGLQSTTIIVSGVALPSGTLVPNGTTIAVTADPAISGTSSGGVILGGTPSPTDSRFKLFTTFGGGFSFTYVSPNRAVLAFNEQGIIQVAPVDTAGTPVNRNVSGVGAPSIGSVGVNLVRGDTVTSFFNPGDSTTASLRANGTALSEVMLTLLRSSSPVSVGSRLAVTVDPVFLPSAGGTIQGGLSASDPRFKIFTTLPDGTIEFTYTAPFLASGTGTAVFQAAAVDDNGTILRAIPFQLGKGQLALNATAGSVAPQPVVVAISPASTQSGVGTNARIMAKFSQPLDPTTVTAGTFSVTSGGAIAGSRVVSASERGPNTLVTFIPTATLPANSSIVVAITSGMKNSLGEALLVTALSSATFSTGSGPDLTAPSMGALNPPSGVLTVGINNVITAEFSEPINATSVTTSTFAVTAGGVPVNGRVKVIAGPRGVNTQAVFTPDQLLGSTITYAVTIGTGITDTAGNPLTAPFNSSFETGVGIDNFQPSLVSVSPQSGAIEVPLNARVTVRFSEPINPQTVHAGTFGVTGRTGTITMAPDFLSATWTPTQALLPNTDYSVLVQTNGTDVIRDLAGNALLSPPLSVGLGSFKTGSGPIDTTGPQVVLVSPDDVATAVPINSQVLLRFSESIAAPSVHGQTVTVAAGGIPIPGTMTLERANTVVRWKLPVLTQFAPNTVYTVTVTTSVTDQVGNPTAVTFTSTFTTGSATDTTAPTITNVTPASGATNVSRATQVAVTLSEAINPATVVVGNISIDGTFSLSSPGVITGIVQGTAAVSGDRKTITFTPTFPLLANQPFTVTLSQIEDMAGNTSVMQRTFTTEVAPGTNLTALPTSAVVTSTPTQLFADGLTSTTVTVTNIVRNGILVPDGTVVGVTADRVFHNFVVGSSAGGTILGGVPSSQDSRLRLFTTLNGSVTLTYQSPNRPDLFNGGVGKVQVGSVDAAGAPISLLGSSDVTLVRGTSGTADANPSSLLANGTSFSEVSISVTDSAAGGQVIPVPSGVTYAVTTEPVYDTGSFPGTLSGSTVATDNRFKLFTTIPGGQLNFIYTAPVLAPGQSRTSTIRLAKVDGSGNLLSPLNIVTNIALSGSTGSVSPQPVVLAVSPTNGQVGVGTTTPISAKFSLPINRATVASSGPTASFTVTQAGTPIPGTFTFAASDRGPDTIVTFVPGTPYTINASIVGNITAGIRSVSGQALRAASTNTFSVALAPDTVAPTLAQSNPGDGAGAVPTNAFISAEFSEPINATTVDATTFAVTLGGTPVAGRFTVAEGGRGKNSIVTFIPNQLLAPNTTYFLSVSNGLKDSAGNAASPATVTFTTTGGIDNVVPTMVSSVPTTGATGFPATGTPITVTFSEPVNPLTVNPNTVKFQSFVPATLALSQNNTVVTVTPLVPFFAGASYTLQLQGVQDVAGNPLFFTSLSFTAVLAPGTTNLPTAATVAFNPPAVFANGQISSQVTITVTRNSVLVPNGTRVAVSAHPSLSSTSLGGTISGPSVGASVDGRFLMFETFGGQIVVNYAPPDLVGQGFTSSGSVSVQVYSIDLDTRPVGFLGSGNIQVTGPSTAVGSANPTTMNQFGSSMITFAQVRDGLSTIVPDGTRIGVRVGTLVNADRFFETSGGGGGGGVAVDIGSAWQGTGVLVPAGTISDGTASAADSNIRIFTTTGGSITATYQAGNAAITGSVIIQAVAIDASGAPVRVLGTANVTLTFVGLGP